MLSLRAVTLRSALICAAGLALAGCTRGCSYGPPATPCQETSECDAPRVCYRGYCSGTEYVETDRRCRAEPRCREDGACGALTVRSFLGADGSLECAAVDEADCRAAQGCITSGLCSLYDGFCVASTAEDCAGSRRCQTHEECHAERFACVRHWPACTPPAAPALAPTWSNAWSGPIEVDMQRMRGPWQPGVVEAGIVACQVQLTRGGDSRVRIGEHCTDGPRFTPGSTETFVRAGVRLRPGDDIAVAVQRDWATSAANDSFVKASYIGTSPFQAGTGGEVLICHVATPEVARSLGMEALVAADPVIAAAMPRPTDDQERIRRTPLDAARRATSEAAVWLGWDDPEVVARVQAMVAVEEAKPRMLAVEFARLRKKTRPPLTRVVFRRELALQVIGHVCGPALNARRLPEERQAVDATQCGVELRIENLSPRVVTFQAGGTRGNSRIGDIALAQWLQVADGRGEAIGVALIDVRAAAETTPRRSADIAPAGTAVILLAGTDQDIVPQPGAQGDFTLLRGQVRVSGGFVLRMELAPDGARNVEPVTRERAKRRSPRD